MNIGTTCSYNSFFKDTGFFVCTKLYQEALVYDSSVSELKEMSVISASLWFHDNESIVDNDVELFWLLCFYTPQVAQWSYPILFQTM